MKPLAARASARRLTAPSTVALPCTSTVTVVPAGGPVSLPDEAKT
jgi:hypothetical protein